MAHEPTDILPDQLAATPEFLDKWRIERIAGIPATPETLYHYTSGGALISILKSMELRATNAVYMNDRTEVQHSVGILRDVIGVNHDRHRDVGIDMMLIAAEQLYSILQIYVVCFCRDGDLLSQWRGYAGTSGYALGFDSKVLKGLTGDHVLLTPVVYDPQTQRRLISDLVGRWQEVFRRSDPGAFSRQIRALGAFVFAQALLFLAASFKNDAFHEEDEWRLLYRRQMVVDDGSGIKIDYVERAGMVGSYATLHLPPPTPQTIPVRHFVIGPTSDPPLAAFSLQAFLRSIGYSEDLIQISSSVVPLRT